MLELPASPTVPNSNPIQEVLTAVTGVVPIAGAVTSLSNVVLETEKLIEQPILNAQQRKPTEDYIESLNEYEQILDEPNEGLRSQRLANYIDRVCIRAEIPVGFIHDGTVRVPLQHFNALVQGINQLVKERAERILAQSKTK